PEVEVDLADEIAAGIELVLDEDGTVIAELQEIIVLEDEATSALAASDEAVNGTHAEPVDAAPIDAERVANDAMVREAHGNGQHHEPPAPAHVSEGIAEEPGASVDDELSVAGAAERAGTDRPHA